MNYSTDRILNPNKHDRAHRYCQLLNLRKKALANQTWLPYRLLSTVFFLLYIILLITQSPSFSSRPSFHHITSSSLSYWSSPFFSLNSFILPYCCKTSDQLTSPSSSCFCPSFHTLTSVSWSNRCPSFRFPFSYNFSSSALLCPYFCTWTSSLHLVLFLYLLSPTARLPLSALRCLLLTPVYCSHSSAARVCILAIYLCAHNFFVPSSADTSPLRICEGFAIMSEHLTCVCLVS